MTIDLQRPNGPTICLQMPSIGTELSALWALNV